MKIIAYILGALALIVWLSSVQVKEKKNILYLQSFANLCYALQYFIFNLISTGLMNMVSVVRSIVFARNIEKNKEPSILLLIIFVLLPIILGTIFYSEPLDLIPIIATVFYSISGWIKKTSVLRYGYIFCSLMFSFYNFQVGAFIPLFGNCCEVISGTISLIRFRKK